ncbi:MAG: PP2C family serine/threonine-protein phosphatase [Lentisphaerota bacterium]
MQQSVRKVWRAFSASVTGPAHLAAGAPCQDSVLVRWFNDVVVAVASDGVGSHIHAEIGAKSACKAVVAAARMWLRRPYREVPDLLRLIQTFWLMEVRPQLPSQSGATCLWVIAEKSGNVTAGRLGDGMVLIADADGLLKTLEDPRPGFANETVALSEGGILLKWEVCHFKLNVTGACICLMTDGISEDLERNKLGEITQIFRELSAQTAPAARTFLLREHKN